MILILPPQVSHLAKEQIEMSAYLHGIKNPVVTELAPDNGFRRFEIVEGTVSAEQSPPSDVG